MNNVVFITRLNKSTGFGNYTRQKSLLFLFRKQKYRTFMLYEGIDARLADRDIPLIPYTEIPKDYLLVLDLPPGRELSAVERSVVEKSRHAFWIIDDSSEDNLLQPQINSLLEAGSVINVSFRVFDYKLSQKYFKSVAVNYHEGRNLLILKDSYNDSLSYILKEKVQNVLICMGGSDPYMISEQVVQFLKNYRRELRFTLVLGPGVDNERYEALKNVEIAYPIEIKKNVVDMARFLVQFDIAIINGGVLRFELGYFGIPFVSIPFNDRQKQISLQLEKWGIGICLDKSRVLTEQNFITSLDSIIGSYNQRYVMHAKMKSLIKNRGVETIIQIIKNEI